MTRTLKSTGWKCHPGWTVESEVQMYYGYLCHHAEPGVVAVSLMY